MKFKKMNLSLIKTFEYNCHLYLIYQNVLL
jgi:hypothetical protein